MFGKDSNILVYVQNHLWEKHAFISKICVPFHRAGIISTFISAVFLQLYLFCAKMWNQVRSFEPKSNIALYILRFRRHISPMFPTTSFPFLTFSYRLLSLWHQAVKCLFSCWMFTQPLCLLVSWICTCLPCLWLLTTCCFNIIIIT